MIKLFVFYESAICCAESSFFEIVKASSQIDLPGIQGLGQGILMRRGWLQSIHESSDHWREERSIGTFPLPLKK